MNITTPARAPDTLPPGTIGELSASERDALVAELTTMVRATAKRVLARLPKTVELDDLLSAGMIGLFDALDKFDHAKASDFRKYAGIRVKGAILDELRAQDPLSRTARRKARDFERTARGLLRELGHTPSDEEMAAELGMGVEGYRALEAAVQPVRFASVEAVAEEGGDITSWILDRAETSPQDSLERRALSDLVERELEALTSRRHEHVLRFCFFDDMSNRDIARVLGVSESRASQILSEALEIFSRRIRAALRREGADAPSNAPPAVPGRGVRWQLKPRDSRNRRQREHRRYTSRRA